MSFLEHEDHAVLDSSSDFEIDNTKAPEAGWASSGFSHHRFLLSYPLLPLHSPAIPQGSAASKSDLGATGHKVGAARDPCRGTNKLSSPQTCSLPRAVGSRAQPSS